MSPDPPPILPNRYYLDHFLEMLDFVTAKYPHALEPTHHDFLEAFGRLPEESRCLFVRMVNRRGRLFHRESLRYPEIPCLDGAVAGLLGEGFARAPGEGDRAALLALEPRERLLARLRRAGLGTGLGSVRKGGLIDLLLDRFSFGELFPPGLRGDYLVQDRTGEVEFFLFLYFGSLDSGLKRFALRDLGRARTAGFRSDYRPRFETGEAARACFFYTRLLRDLEEGGAGAAAGLPGLDEWPEDPEAEVTALRHRALHRLGRILEQAGRTAEALEVYLRSDQFPATERAVRLLLFAGRGDEAEAFLLRLIEDPSCDGELLFAEDFLERKFQRRKTGRLTTLLRESPVLELDETGRARPEEATAARLRREGAFAAHVENRIWSQLFGLLFWDRLFGPEHASLHDPFDFFPRDLATGTFFSRHGAAVGERLALLGNPPAALAELERTWAAQFGVPNPLVPWDEELFALTRRLVAEAPPGALAAVLEAVAREPRTERSGFPDLVVFDERGCRFLEVKAEGDQIRRQQLVQIERLRRAGFSVGVVRVRWTVDPDQEYVVVDLETTGGDVATHRITEIGAVRVRGGEIIGEWSTLVNPGRRIPGFVSRLTGITDEMVVGAPRFEEVAADLRRFLGDAVFVAHRARFDHGFLRAEYARLGQDLSGPVLCTVVESRRWFPGLPSYGLAALCQHFGLSLESHHRALCDARATAELWRIIQERRLAGKDSGGPERES